MWLWQAATNRKRVENIAKRKLDSLMKESKIRDCEDTNDFTVSTLPPSGKLGHKAEGKKVRARRPVTSACSRVKGLEHEVCAHRCTCVCIHTRPRMRAHTRTHLRVHTCASAHTPAHTYLCTRTPVHTPSYLVVHTHGRAHTCTHLLMHTCTSVHTPAQTYLCAHTPTYLVVHARTPVHTPTHLVMHTCAHTCTHKPACALIPLPAGPAACRPAS